MGFFLFAASQGDSVEKGAEKPLLLILLGPPGAGKGTHAIKLKEQTDLPHISSGDLLREHIKKKTGLGTEAKNYMDQGKLVPDNLVLTMLFERLNENDCEKGAILDGFPRTLPQAESLDSKMGQTSNLLVLYFAASDDALVDRIAGRLICQDCKRPFHKLYDPPQKQGICTACNGRLFTREDDQESIVRKRLEVYRQETKPLIEYYNRKKGVLKEVDAEKGKERIYADLLDILPFSLPSRLSVP